jgi:tetratricopeptide (TPR) repeat protein
MAEPRHDRKGRRRPPPSEQRRSPHEPVHLSDDIVAELHATARPGKGAILTKIFADAAAAFADGDLGEAIRLGEQAKHIALRSPAVRELLGIALYRARRWRDAARELSAFRRIAGTTEQNPVLADCYRALGRPERALEICDEVERGRVPDAVFYEARIVAAGALRDMGRADDAIRRLEALQLHPDRVEVHHLRAWYALADVLESRGRFTQARSLFEAVASTDADLTDAPERARRLARRSP